MINYYHAIAKHNDMQGAASAHRQPVPDYDASYQEILANAQMHRAILLKRNFKSAWAMLRKAMSHQSASSRIAGNGAVG